MIVRRGNDPARWENHGPVTPYSPRSYGGASGAVTIPYMKPVLTLTAGQNYLPGPGEGPRKPASIVPEVRR